MSLSQMCSPAMTPMTPMTPMNRPRTMGSRIAALSHRRAVTSGLALLVIGTAVFWGRAQDPGSRRFRHVPVTAVGWSDVGDIRTEALNGIGHPAGLYIDLDDGSTWTLNASPIERLRQALDRYATGCPDAPVGDKAKVADTARWDSPQVTIRNSLFEVVADPIHAARRVRGRSEKCKRGNVLGVVTLTERATLFTLSANSRSNTPQNPREISSSLRRAAGRTSLHR